MAALRHHLPVPASRNVPAGEKSIAVLPFVDMSPQKDQEYFCDGMTEELINRLSKIQDLRVPARTSAFYLQREDRRHPGDRQQAQRADGARGKRAESG